MAVHLRALHGNDALPIYQYMQSEDMHRFLTDQVPFPYTTEHAFQFVDQAMGCFPLTCAIDSDGVFAGVIGLNEKGDIFRVNLEIGYWLAKPFWGQGIMSEAIRQMTNVAFRQSDITRVFANVFAENIGSIRALEKNGYEREGYHPDSLIKHNTIWDCAVYAMTKKRWYAAHPFQSI